MRQSHVWEGENEMTEIHEGVPAPDFALADTQGHSITLSDYQGQKHVVLVFNRGFT